MKFYKLCGVALVLALGILLLSGSITVAQDSDTEAVYRAAYEAFNEGDVDGGMALIADDVIGVLLPPPPGVDAAQVGKEPFRQIMEDLVASNAHWELMDFHVDGETASYRVTLEAEDFLADLGVYPMEFTGWVVVRDGLIQAEAWNMNEATRAKLDQAMAKLANEEAVRRYMDELWSEGDISVADEVVAEDFVSYWSPPLEGREALKEEVVRYRAENPGAYFPIEDLVMTDDKAYITNRMWVIPEDAAEGDKGEPVTPYFLVVLGVENGQITERWFFMTPQ